MSRLTKTAKLATPLLTTIALISAPVGAWFGYLAWQEAKGSGPDLAAIRDGTDRLATASEIDLDRRRLDLELQRGILAALARLLPEAERSRIGLERLAALTEQRLREVTDEQERHRQKPVARAAKHGVMGWTGEARTPARDDADTDWANRAMQAR